MVEYISKLVIVLTTAAPLVLLIENNNQTLLQELKLLFLICVNFITHNVPKNWAVHHGYD